MLHSLTAAAVLVSVLASTPPVPRPVTPTAPPAPPAALPAQNPKASKTVKALRSWIKSYRAGRYDMGTPWETVTKKSVAKRSGLVPKDMFKAQKGDFNAFQELDLLCRLGAEENSALAAQVLLEISAVGLDRAYKYKPNMVPKMVCAIGQQYISKFNSIAARKYFVAAAEGNPVGPKKIKTALQAAACRVLGQFEEEEYLPVLEKQLASPDPLIRSHAAEGIGLLARPKSLQPIVVAFEKEDSEVAHAGMTEALLRIFFNNQGKVDHAVMKRSINAGAKKLGKGSWQNSITLIDFLVNFPDGVSVPPLIALLSRFEEHPEQIDEGTLSGLLRVKVHFALTNITGAFYGADDVQIWKDFWARVKDNFQVPNNKKSLEQRMREFQDAEKKRKASEKQVGGDPKIAVMKRKKKPATVTSEFFGIKIEGTRVVFVIDTSGSMSLNMQFRDKKYRDDALKGRVDRMVVAKNELKKAVETLSPDVHFNVITYSDKVKSWQKNNVLVPATDKNKKALYSYLRRLGPNGNTNIYDGLATGVKIKSLVYGDRFDSPVDEVFLLSDGVPNRGAVKQAQMIKETIRQLNRFSRVRINTVFTGMDNDPADKQEVGLNLMKDLAKMTGGKFIRP